MFLMTSQGDVAFGNRRAFLPDSHSAKVGSGLMASFCPSEALISSCPQVLLPELKEGVLGNEPAPLPLCSLAGVFMYGGAEGSEFTDKPGGLEGAEEKLSGCEVWSQILLTSSFPHWVGWRAMVGSSGVVRGVDPHTGLDKPGVRAPGVILRAPQLLSDDRLLSNSSRVPWGVLTLLEPLPLDLGGRLVGGAILRPPVFCCLLALHDDILSPIPPADPGGN